MRAAQVLLPNSISACRHWYRGHTHSMSESMKTFS
jgi:hypothetical protein